MKFMKYRYKEIGERIKEFRGGRSTESLYEYHESKEKKASIHANILSTLENGETFQNNKSYLTKKVLRELSDQLGVCPRQIN
ncbi:hypothetical protein [Bacillus subtilis]|uniref:hypothetical protein n=1 Tax=Bacillus subtilis TaxID=1423 RepID=UPI003F744812